MLRGGKWLDFATGQPLAVDQKTITYTGGTYRISFSPPPQTRLYSLATDNTIFPKGTYIYIPAFGSMFRVEDKCNGCVQTSSTHSPVVDVFVGVAGSDFTNYIDSLDDITAYVLYPN
jgi:hypothetical protein